MRFSEARTDALARQIARALIDKGTVEPKVGVANLASLIAQAMIRDMRQEEAIEEEAREQLARQRNLPPEGSPPYEALFARTKQEIASRKGYPL